MTDEYVSAKLAEARAALGSGNRASAYFALKRALKRDADNPEAKLLAARLNLADGDIAGASNITRDLLAAGAGEEGGAEAESLAELCLGCELWFDAARLYAALCQEQPDNESFNRRAGQASYRCGRLSDARDFFQRCIALRPERADNFLQLGHAARAQGDLRLAEEQYRHYVANSEEGKAAGYWSLADLPGHEFSDEDIKAMNELTGRLPGDGPDASMLQFAMGVAAEQGKRFKQAFGHFRQANATQSQFRQFSAAEFERTLKSLASARSNLAPSVPAGEITPVFVVGLPGSGIAQVERVFAAHPAVGTTGGL
ncbi:MAG: tetratricopeptide repeat protein, partial [Xanthomonadales bacterium]|nr:tetratricopeptide repeat protein [Xanthomonadales bacterium]NIX12268.1 tetratricopeptide repeat protein [Xanthomonadales bacterium]